MAAACLACCASRIVRPVVSGTFTGPFSRTLPSMSTEPSNDCSWTRSLKAARRQHEVAAAPCRPFWLTLGKLHQAVVLCERQRDAAAREGVGPGRHRCWDRRLNSQIPLLRIDGGGQSRIRKMVRFISHLASCHVENQAPRSAFGSRWSAPLPERSTDQKWGKATRKGRLRAGFEERVVPSVLRPVASSHQDSHPAGPKYPPVGYAEVEVVVGEAVPRKASDSAAVKVVIRKLPVTPGRRAQVKERRMMQQDSATLKSANQPRPAKRAPGLGQSTVGV